MELEKGKNFDYWNDITILVEDELHKLKKMKRQAEFEGQYLHILTKQLNSLRLFLFLMYFNIVS